MAPNLKLVDLTPTGLQAHPAAELFPLMTGADFDALVADIREHGQREAIVVHDGMILDGRNRYRACQALGIEPVVVQWDRSGAPPEAYAVSMNLHRRHLSESQRAMIAARLVTTKSGQRADLIRKSEGHQISRPCMTTGEAAQLLNVSSSTVQSARRVLSEATPEEIASVDRGEVAASTIANEIRQGLRPERRRTLREAPLAQAGKNPERIQRAQMQADIWAHVNEALTALTSLPLPSDVADIVRKNPARTRAVNDRLTRSLQWLKDFENVWRNRD